MREEERSPVRGHKLEKPSSLPMKKEDKGMQVKLHNINPGTKSNLSLGHNDLVK